MAILCSVTVSIGDDTNGVFTGMLREKLEERVTLEAGKSIWPTVHHRSTGEPYTNNKHYLSLFLKATSEFGGVKG